MAFSVTTSWKLLSSHWSTPPPCRRCADVVQRGGRPWVRLTEKMAESIAWSAARLAPTRTWLGLGLGFGLGLGLGWGWAKPNPNQVGVRYGTELRTRLGPLVPR